MLPDSIPAAKAAETFEAQFRQWELPQAPASLDARVQALLADTQTKPAAHRPVWRQWVSIAAALAAGMALALLLWPPSKPAPTAGGLAQATAVKTPTAPAAEPQAPPKIFEGAVPVGYEYQGSRTLYAEEIPSGTLTDRNGQPLRAYRRETMQRHLFRDPKTHATYEVDEPREDIVLEQLTSY